MTLKSHSELMGLIKRKLEEQGYTAKLEATAYKGVRVDLLARKDGETLAIEVKTSRMSVFDALGKSEKLRIQPDIDFVYIAAPKGIIEEDILNFAKYPRIGVGVIGVTEQDIEWLVKASKKDPANLSGGYSYRSSVTPGEIFPLRIDVENRGGKIARNIEVSYIPVDPFTVPPGEVSQKKIDELLPEERRSPEFRVKVKEEAEPGRYFLFTKRSAQGLKPDAYVIEVEVKPKGEEYIQRIAAEAVAELNHAILTNIENLLRDIDKAVMDGHINLNKHVFDKSIWNTIGLPCFNNGLYKQAELIYRKMLETLRKFEKEKGERVHKGLALHNLGIALYFQGRMKEAREKFLEAYEEDKVTYGEESASKGVAKKALDKLSFEIILG